MNCICLKTGKQIPVGGADANAYEFQASGVIDMLENLESKFVDELREVQRTEANAAHAYNMEMQSNSDQTAVMATHRCPMENQGTVTSKLSIRTGDDCSRLARYESFLDQGSEGRIRL